MKLLIICLFAVGTALLAGGCASSNVNPDTARHNTGYVDFYVTETNDLFWDVTDTASNKKVFSEFRPLGGPILRLAFKPGQYQFQVTFLNRLISDKGTADVDVRDGMVTPIMVALQPMDSSVVQSKSTEVGKTFYGRFRQRTNTQRTQTVNYKIVTEPQSPLPFRRKELMSYFQPPQ
jgi:hypothetical protein